jgi:predicted ribosomally synthesized peptide with SipW-like signal peptide
MTATRHARKILGSVGAIGVAAALAGLGTFGTFTDSTSADTAIQAGTFTIDLGIPGGPSTIPVSTANFLPGDSLTRGVNLVNSGDTAASSINLATTITPAGPLATDPTNGLQLTLTACSRAWTRAGTTVPTYSCGGTQTTVYSGPAVSTQALPSPDSLNPGGTDKLIFTLSLPSTAGNSLQNQTATFSLAFSALQRGGSTR